MLFAFGRYLFASTAAGLIAAFLFAIFPGSVYYGRTFTPDTTMTFFLTAALYASARWILDRGAGSWRGWWPAAVLTAVAILAKPVALLGLAPVAVLLYRRDGPRALARPQTWGFFIVGVLPYLIYDRYVSAHAEWHWASGITRLHVLPSLAHALVSVSGFERKGAAFFDALGMLAHTMLGPVGFSLALLGTVAAVALRPADGTARGAYVTDYLLSWLVAGLVYAYVVVTVERVDYYLYPFVPLAALLGALLIVELSARFGRAPSRVTTATAGLALVATLAVNALEIAPYYVYSRLNYRAARALDAALPKDAIVVMAHYDPSILYYINRKGWEEDPLLWTPFDEESAIGKGSRYFIAVEDARLRKNAELYAWLQRFPVSHPEKPWPVYVTDPAAVLPGAEERWQQFRRTEKGKPSL